MRVETRLKAYRDLVDRRLEQILPSEETEPRALHQAMRYSSLAPGKRLRPALCLASASAVGGGASKSVLDGACATEMVHCFSLIHDDLPAIDDDSLRRGAPTCHVKFGEAIALLAGDALFALAFETLANCGAAPDRLTGALRCLAKASGSDGLVGGEVLDILAEGREIGEDALEFIHSRKTGALIAASCEIGALIAGGSQAQVGHLRQFGEKLGLAFQVVDDLLDEVSTPEELGKSTGADRRLGKATYPSVCGIEGAKKAAERLLDSALAELDGSLENRALLEDLAVYSVRRLH